MRWFNTSTGECPTLRCQCGWQFTTLKDLLYFGPLIFVSDFKNFQS
jgi:hypothetical protein